MNPYDPYVIINYHRNEGDILTRTNHKFTNTALRMDEAFLKILERKEYAYITIKEICEEAQVNRSTFYLHYENINDLLLESIEYINQKFLDYMDRNSENFISNIQNCEKKDLYLITPKYLFPYLQFIKQNKELIQCVYKNKDSLQSQETYHQMTKHVFTPIFNRLSIPESKQNYLLTFYIKGIMGVINQWLEKDCKESIEEIIEILQQCCMPNKIK